MTPDVLALLAAYDAELRTDAETRAARSVTRMGPLHLAVFGGGAVSGGGDGFRGGRGFVTYRDLSHAGAPPTAASVRALVADAVAFFGDGPAVGEVEWKTRGHDVAPGLHEALVEHGFERGEVESVVVGDARLLAVDVPLPDGVSLRRVTDERDVAAMVVMQAEVFAQPATGHDVAERVAELMRGLADGSGTEYWVAQAHGDVVCAGRVEPVPGTQFAGLWGGATLPAWRGRGIYRALTAARARSALARGVRYLHSDSTPFSRRILERSGLVTVSTTTPYTWRRATSA